MADPLRLTEAMATLDRLSEAEIRAGLAEPVRTAER